MEAPSRQTQGIHNVKISLRWRGSPIPEDRSVNVMWRQAVNPPGGKGLADALCQGMMTSAQLEDEGAALHRGTAGTTADSAGQLQCRSVSPLTGKTSVRGSDTWWSRSGGDKTYQEVTRWTAHGWLTIRYMVYICIICLFSTCLDWGPWVYTHWRWISIVFLLNFLCYTIFTGFQTIFFGKNKF